MCVSLYTHVWQHNPAGSICACLCESGWVGDGGWVNVCAHMCACLRVFV